jgi:hypothetical protein
MITQQGTDQLLVKLPFEGNASIQDHRHQRFKYGKQGV